MEVLKNHGRNAEEAANGGAVRPQGSVVFGPFRFEPGNGLWRGPQEIALPPRALALLEALVAQAGGVVSKQALMDAVWKDAFVTEASLLEAIRVLREALDDDRLRPRYIQTVHRRGYRFIAPIEGGPAAAAIATTKSESPAVPPVSSFAPGPHWAPLITAAAASVAATIGIALVFALFGQRPPEPRPTTRFTIALPAGAVIDPLRGSVAVSNDGTRMVYVALDGGRPRLFLRSLERDAPQRIDGSDDAADPFFSPDGEWVGFFAHGRLMKLRVTGGTPVPLCSARAGGGASWGHDGTIVFGGAPGGGLARISSEGGDPTPLTAPRAGSSDVIYGWPDVLPDGSGILYTAVSIGDSRIALFEPETATTRVLLRSAAFARYSPTGHLVFERRGRLEAAPFSLAEQRLTGLPRPILRGLATSDFVHSGPRFAFSRTGALIYVPGASADIDDRLHWLDVRGGLDPLPLPPAPLGSIDVAPDLKRLALTMEDEDGQDLWVGDLERGALSRLSSDGRSASPTWRPDGLAIAFAYSKAGPFNLFARPPDSDAAPHRLLESDWNQVPTSWSPDGGRLLFTEFHPLTGADIWVLDVATRQRRALVRSAFDESHARFSPDGRWIAYMTNESGRWEVFVRAADAAATMRVQVSTSGGAYPAWSVDGRTLYFSANGEAAAAAVHTSPQLAVSAPLVIPARDELQLVSGRAASDRVLVREAGVSPARRELRVVLEWFAELTRLVRQPA